MMPDNDNLLHQIRFILYDAGIPLSPYEIAYRLLTTKLQTSESVELLRQQVCRLVAASPLYLLQRHGLVRTVKWPEGLRQTVMAVHRAYTAALTSDYEDLPEWYQPVLIGLLCYRYFSEIDDKAIVDQSRFCFVLQHSTPTQWPQQLSEVMRVVTLSDPKLQSLFTYTSLHLPDINPAFIYQVVQQVQCVSLSDTASFAFIPVVRKLFGEQIREARLWLRFNTPAGQVNNLK
jgi:hypothetical protein